MILTIDVVPCCDVLCRPDCFLLLSFAPALSVTANECLFELLDGKTLFQQILVQRILIPKDFSSRGGAACGKVVSEVAAN